jgi:hypothetical protein
LFKDIEMAVEMTIRTVRDTIAVFNEYREVKTDLSNRESDQEQQEGEMANTMIFERESRLPIDIEGVQKHSEIFIDIIAQKWVKNARIQGTADMLREIGKHEDYIWKRLREEMGLEPRA